MYSAGDSESSVAFHKASSVRFLTPSFLKSRYMYSFTLPTVSESSKAISLFDFACLTSSTSCRSRAVNEKAAGDRKGRVSKE